MSGGCWNYMNDSTANEILGYHIYVGYGLDSERHEKNYRMVVRENPLGDPEIPQLSYTMYSAFFTHMIGLVQDTDFDVYQKDVAIFKDRWFKRAQVDRIKEMIDISTKS